MSPVRASERRRYPLNWRAISARIRFFRAGGQCECEGECGTGHEGRCTARHGQPHPVTGSMVMLTTAHLDHVPEHCQDENLRAMCQRCHLAYDAAHHAATRAARQWSSASAGSHPDLGGSPMAVKTMTWNTTLVVVDLLLLRLPEELLAARMTETAGGRACR